MDRTGSAIAPFRSLGTQVKHSRIEQLHTAISLPRAMEGTKDAVSSAESLRKNLSQNQKLQAGPR